MKICNHTNYDTRQLRALITRTLREQEKIEGSLRYKKALVVDIRYQRRNGYLGRGAYSGLWMGLYLKRDGIDVHQLTNTIWHESWHLRGYRHRDCTNNKYSFGKLPANAAWWQEYSVGERAAKPKPPRDMQGERYGKIIARLEDKQKRLRRLQNQIKKLAQQRKYYERKLAARQDGFTAKPEKEQA